jgi:ribosome maturation factor RimP
MGLTEETGTDQLRRIAEAVARDNFLELFDLVVRPQGKKLHLTVVLDKKSGPVTLDECTMVSRELEKKLDELDLIGPAYLLEVSSPGMDRPLRNLEDCRRFEGRLAQFVFDPPVEGISSFRGRLGTVSDGQVELTEGSRTLRAPFEAVKRAHLVVEL